MQDTWFHTKIYFSVNFIKHLYILFPGGANGTDFGEMAQSYSLRFIKLKKKYLSGAKCFRCDRRLPRMDTHTHTNTHLIHTHLIQTLHIIK